MCLTVSPDAYACSGKCKTFFVFIIRRPSMIPAIAITITPSMVSISTCGRYPFRIAAASPQIRTAASTITPTGFSRPGSFESSPSLTNSFRFSLSSGKVSSSANSISCSVFFAFIFSFFSPFTSEL